MFSLYICIILNLLYGNLANSHLTRDSRSPNQITINPGVYLQRLPNVTFYQATQQILFKFQKPIDLFNDNICATQVCKKYPQFCDNLLNLTTYFDHIEPFINFRPISENELILRDDGELHDFQYATRSHVPRLFTTTYEVQLLMSRISRARGIPIRELFYHNPLKNLYNNVTYSDPAIIHPIILEILSIYEWTRSFTDMCQSKKLKLNIVTMHELSNALNSIKNQMLDYNFTLSLDSISSYYSLPITECTMSEKIALIGIHVPLILHSLRDLSMKRIVTPPFAWNTHTCSIQTTTDDIAVTKTTNGYIFLSPKCDTFREDLCLLNQHDYTNALTISCAKHLLMDSTALQLSKYCPMKCVDNGITTESIIRLEANTYVITHPQVGTAVICTNNTYSLHDYPRIGAIKVKLTCKCRIQGHHVTILAAKATCTSDDQSIYINHVIPSEWLKFQILKIPTPGQPPLTFDKLEDCLNDNWIIEHTTTSMTTNLSMYFLILSFVIIFLHIIFTIFICRRILQLSAASITSHIDKSNQKTFSRSPLNSEDLRLLPIPTRNPQPQLPQTPDEEEENYLVPTPIPDPGTTHQYESLHHTVSASQRHLHSSGGTIRHQSDNRLQPIPEEPHYLPMSTPSTYVQMNTPRSAVKIVRC